MERNITYPEFKRRVFNTAMLECMTRIHRECLTDGNDDPNDVALAESIATVFFNHELGLDKAQIRATKQRLSEATTFIKDCADQCEEIADTKCKDAADAKLQIPDSQKIELSDEDKVVLDKVFEGKKPELAIDTVRDATVKALQAEDQKAQELKAATDMSGSTGDMKQLEETVTRLSNRGPSSLMNAIMNNFAQAAVRDVQSLPENAGRPISRVMKDNADTIKTRAVMTYALYEMASVFGIHNYTPAEVRKISFEIYNGK